MSYNNVIIILIFNYSNYFTSLSTQIHTVKVPSNNFNQSPSLKFIMTFQRLLIMSIYRKKRNKDGKCHCELGNYRFIYGLNYVFCLNFS